MCTPETNYTSIKFLIITKLYNLLEVTSVMEEKQNRISNDGYQRGVCNFN